MIINNITEKEFRDILLRADWFYEYAEGEAYWKGKRSVHDAYTAYDKFRKVDKKLAEKIWNEFKLNRGVKK